MQDPTGHDNTVHGFLPYIKDPVLGLFLNIVVHPSIFPSERHTHMLYVRLILVRSQVQFSTNLTSFV